MRPSYIVWGSWFLAFVVLELLGVFHAVPWKSLSQTAWTLESLSGWVKIIVLAGLVVLTVHIVAHWP
jgi:hypothetical protein